VGGFDAIVVGGGIAGVSIAYELAVHARVLLLEQERRLAYHTTGRSAAMYLQSYGNPTVRALTVASRGDFDTLSGLVDGTPLLIPKPLLWIADAGSAGHLEEMLSSESPLRALSPAEALELCPALRPEKLVAAAHDLSAMEIDVHAVHNAYVQGFRARGGVIRAESAADGLARQGGQWQVEAGGFHAAAPIVVNASGAWGDVTARLAGVRPIGLRPLRRTIFTSPVTGWTGLDAWPFISDAGDRFYFKGEHDQVMVSPADETPDVPRDATPADVDIARAIETVNEHTRLQLRSVRSSWAGLRTFAPDRSPVVGEAVDAPGFFWYVGQGGYGIQMAPALARTGAALALGRPLPADVSALGVTAGALSASRPGLAFTD
jgi:D-arginine dehydrogenase